MKFKKVLNLIFKHPSVLLPFLCLAILEALCLSSWYYSPRPLISYVFAPPIQAFMGEKFLHYPYLFLALPRLMFISRIFLYLGFGIVSLSMSVCAVYQAHEENGQVRFWPNLNRALRKLPLLFSLGVIFCLIAFCFYKVPRVVIAKIVSDNSLIEVASYFIFFFTFLFLTFWEGLFTLSCINYVLKNQSITASIKNAFSFFRKKFWKIIIFIASMRLLIFGLTLIKWNISYLLEKVFPLFPEIVLVILGLEIGLYFLANVVIVSGITLELVESWEGSSDVR